MTKKTKTKPEPRCSCVDNRWACEKHNAPRALEPIHYSTPSIGSVCGWGGHRSESDLSEFKRLCEETPREVCPTCALRCHALDQRDRRDAERRNPPPKFDPVSKPAHYNAGKVECIDALEAATIALTGIEAVCTANAIKYLWRHSEKNGTEDLEKCIWYVKRLIAARKARGAK